MLTIKSIQGGTAGKWGYYQEKDNYYLTDKDSLSETGLWFGKGAEALGLSGKADGKVFTAMLEGLLPNGDQLGKHEQGRLKHRPGYDVHIAPPKSVSLLLLIGGDERLEKAVREANNFIMSRIETDLAQARIKAKGNVTFENTGKLVMTQFHHTTSREIDPQRHTHNLIQNATQTADGQWRSLASTSRVSARNEGTFEQLYRDQKFYGLLHTNELAQQVKALGYEIRIVDKHGNFEIEGIPREIIDYFSKRQQQIKARLNEKGMSGARAAEVAALDSRQFKQAVESGEVKAYWKDEVKKLAVDLDQLIKDSYERLKTEPEREQPQPIERNAQSERYLHFALWHLGEYSTRISHGDLVRQAFRFAEGRLGHEIIEDEIRYQLQSGQLLGKAGQYYTTAKLIAQEKTLIETIQASLGTSQGLTLPKDRSPSFTETLLASKDRIQVINIKGFHQEKPLVQALVEETEANGITAQVLHVGKTQTSLLQQTIQRTKVKQSLFDWLASVFTQKPDLVQTVAGFSARRERGFGAFWGAFDAKKDCIIVHDAQKLSLSAFERLNALAEKGQSKLLLLNNTEARTDFKAGHVMATIEQAGIKPLKSPLKTQREPIVLKASQQPLQTLAKHYLALTPEEKAQTTLVCTTNKQQAELVQQLRSQQQISGELGWQSTPFRVLSTQGLSEAEKSQARFYRSGDRLLVNLMDPKKRAIYRVISPKAAGVSRQALGPNRVPVVDKAGKVSVYQLNANDTVWVNRAKQLDIAEGEQLRLAKPWYEHKEYQEGQVFTVKRVTPEGIEVESQGQTARWSRGELTNAILEYAYTKKPHQINQTDQVIATPLAAYQMSRQLLHELSDGQKQLQVFTLDEDKAKQQLMKSKLPWQASEVAAGKPAVIYRDIQYADHTIRHDLEQVASALQSQNKKATVDTAVSYALAKLGEREAAFEHQELLTAAITYALGEVKESELTQAIKAKQAAGQLLGNGSVWTSREALELEQGIFDKIKANQQVLKPIHPKEQPMPMPDHLTQGQRNAVALSLTTKDRFVSVQGLAGTGKTTMMRTLKEKTVAQGFQVIGLAPTHVAVKKMDSSLELEDPGRRLKAAGIETLTIHRFVFDDSINFDAKSLFIVDEVSMLGSRLFSDLQDKLIESGGRALLVGDKNQNPAVEAGKPVPLAQAAGVLPYVEMNEVMRQKDPNYKQAVLLASEHAIHQSANALDRLKPHDTIDREANTPHTFPNTTFVEISSPEESSDEQAFDSELSHFDEGQQSESTQAPEVTIHEAMANDYLTRTPEHRAKTLVVADAHEDRYLLNDFIREGLKARGIIDSRELQTNRLVSKNLDQADILHVKNYESGDVLYAARSFGGINEGDHWIVKRISAKDNELLCHNPEAQIEMSFNPAKLAIPAQLSVLTSKESPVGIGDRLRLRHTNRERGWLANAEYTVKHIDQGKVSLVNEQGELLVLNTQQASDRHWDYAYTYTSYGVQGLDDRSVIGMQLSYRKNATTHKTFLVHITRGKESVVIYTDDKGKLLERLDDPTGQQKAEKTSALETLGFVEQAREPSQVPQPTELSAEVVEVNGKGMSADEQAYFNDQGAAKSSPLLGDIFSQKTKQSGMSTDEQAYFNEKDSAESPQIFGDSLPSTKQADDSQKTKPQQPKESKLDAKVIGPALVQQTERLAITLLGEPNHKLSTSGQLRYGSKGSLVINVESGLWFNHETGEKGNLLQLVQQEQGFSDFKAALRYASDFLGHAPLPEPKRQPKPTNAKGGEAKGTTQDYARKLYNLSKPLKGTLAEEYLKDHRKLHQYQQADLRFLPWIASQPEKGKDKIKVPALLAFAKDEKGEIHHIQVIKLDRQTAKKDTRSAVAKQTYGPSKGYGIECNVAR